MTRITIMDEKEVSKPTGYEKIFAAGQALSILQDYSNMIDNDVKNKARKAASEKLLEGINEL